MVDACEAPADLLARVVVVGDAGSPRPTGDRILDAARDCVLLAGSAPAAAVFVGDNVYGAHRASLRAAIHGGPYGGFRAGHRREQAQIDAQIAVLPEGRAWFVAGNHDWYAGARGLRDQAARVGAGWLGGTGCDDLRVDTVSVGPVRLVAFDSMAAFRCGDDGRLALGADLRRAIPGDGVVILAAHHPLTSVGPHGRGRIPQDMGAPRYRRYREMLGSALDATDATLIFAAGHDHGLAWIPFAEGPLVGQIVSGAGSEDVRLDRHGEVRGIDARSGEDPDLGERGFVVVDVRPDGIEIHAVHPTDPTRNTTATARQGP